jgi:hypothetical protein
VNSGKLVKKKMRNKHDMRPINQEKGKKGVIKGKVERDVG